MQTSNPSEKDNMTNNSAFFTSTDLKYQVSSFPGDKLRDYPEYLRALLQRKPMEPWATSHRKKLPRSNKAAKSF